jgi:hypothetical protein
MAEFFRFLFETNLVNAAFVVGSIAVLLAIVGRIKTIIEPSPPARIVLGGFGLFLIVLSLTGYGVGYRQKQALTSVVEPGLTQSTSAASQSPAVAADPPIPPAGGQRVCQEQAFNGDLRTTDPLFLRPVGYLSGWISSDASTVVLPDGTTKLFPTQYVLIVEDLAYVQVKGVQGPPLKVNTSGCWYPAELSQYVDEDAKSDFCVKKNAGNRAVFYRASASGLAEIGTTDTLACP